MTNKFKTRLWGAAENLEAEASIAAYLAAALEDVDPTLIGATLGDIARAKGIMQISLHVPKVRK